MGEETQILFNLSGPHPGGEAESDAYTLGSGGGWGRGDGITADTCPVLHGSMTSHFPVSPFSESGGKDRSPISQKMSHRHHYRNRSRSSH